MRLAAERGQHDAVRVMLDLGADPGAADEGGRTALHAAAAEGQLTVIELLLAAGVDASAQDGEGRSALDLAETAGFDDAAQALKAAR